MGISLQRSNSSSLSLLWSHHHPVPLRKTCHAWMKVLLCQCKMPPCHPLLLSEPRLRLLCHPDDQAMPAEACSTGFVFAATVNRSDTLLHSWFMTEFCVLNRLFSRAELFSNHIPCEFSCRFSSAPRTNHRVHTTAPETEEESC